MNVNPDEWKRHGKKALTKPIDQSRKRKYLSYDRKKSIKKRAYQSQFFNENSQIF